MNTKQIKQKSQGKEVETKGGAFLYNGPKKYPQDLPYPCRFIEVEVNGKTWFNAYHVSPFVSAEEKARAEEKLKRELRKQIREEVED